MSKNLRDINQRSIGCIGLSAIAHTSLLATLLLTGRSSEVSEVDRELKSAAGRKSSNPVEVMVSAPVESPAAPAKKSLRISKPVAAAKALKTIEKSDVAADVGPTGAPRSVTQPEIEELSPVIAEESAAPEQVQEAVVSEAVPEAVPEAAAAQAAPEPQEVAAVQTVPAEQVAVAKPAAEPAASSADMSSKTGSGSDKTSGEGAVEASARSPLAGNPLPQYPRQDRLQNREGIAVVLGDVRRDGMIENVRLDKSSGSREMDMESVKAFKKWKFAPGKEAVVRKSFQFRLQGDAQVGYATLKR